MNPRLLLALGVFAGSGACALVNQVLWPRGFAVVFGGTHRAEALVLAAFFCGLAAGSALGARLAATAGPGLWKRYAACEAAAGATAILPILLVLAFRNGLPGPPEGSAPLMLLVALLSMLPPVVAHGATWPLMVSILRARGRAVAGIYAITTGGAVLGCLLASFVLVEAFGTRGGLIASAVGSLSLAALAVGVLARQAAAEGEGAQAEGEGEEQKEGEGEGEEKKESEGEEKKESEGEEKKVGHGHGHGHGHGERAIWVVGIVSGLLVLAFEAAAARLFAQRLAHTTYSFGTVLAVQLVGMVAGGLAARRLTQWKRPPLNLVTWAAALALATVPLIAQVVSSPSRIETWAGLVWRTILDVVLVAGPAAFLLGILFPLASGLLATARSGEAPGGPLGRLAAYNAVAALAGSLIVAFVLVPVAGLAATFGALAIVGGIAAVVATPAEERKRAPVIGGIVGVLVLAAIGPAVLKPVPLQEGEQVIKEIEGAAATVTVVEDAHGERRMVANARYTLGTSQSFVVHRRLALLPYVLRPQPERALLVGLATGITGGGARDAAGSYGGKVDIAELLPEVVELAGEFKKWHGTGPPARLIVADGRRVLARAPHSYDLILFDLFLPWRPGTAYLYTQESFALARDRLAPGGSCALWLPLYQLSPESLVLILRTFESVFPAARIYLATLRADRPFLGVVSHVAPHEASERERARLAAVGALRGDPLLTLPNGARGLEVGPLRDVLSSIASVLEVVALPPDLVQRDDLPYVEFDCPRSQARGDVVAGAPLQMLVAAADRAKGWEKLDEHFPDATTLAVRAAWLPLQAAPAYLTFALRDARLRPFVARIAREKRDEARTKGQDDLVIELSVILAQCASGQERADSISLALRGLVAGGAQDRALDLLSRVLPGEGPVAPGNAALAMRGGQLALSLKVPTKALAWLARVPPGTPLESTRRLLEALAHRQLENPAAAKAALLEARRLDPAGTAQRLSQIGAQQWADELLGN